MNNIQIVILGISIPFLGTALGSALVFLLKKQMSTYTQKILLGFASGAMMSASMWSLLMPAVNITESQGKIAWIPASVGFLLGVIILMTIEKLVQKLEKFRNKIQDKISQGITDIEEPEKKADIKEKIKNVMMLVIAVTIHNIPQGMAEGVLLAGLICQTDGITLIGELTLSLGMAIQNVPEGAIVSMPLRSSGMSRTKSFVGGILSGIAEAIGAIATVSLSGVIVSILPYLLAFAAGGMIYVISAELIPEIHKGEYAGVGVISLSIGFTIMMILDIALG